MASGSEGQVDEAWLDLVAGSSGAAADAWVKELMNLYLGWAENYLERYDDAMDQLHRALEGDPQHAQAHYLLGRVYEMKGQYLDAARSLRDAVALEPSNTPYMAALAGEAVRRGNCHRGQRVHAERPEGWTSLLAVLL